MMQQQKQLSKQSQLIDQSFSNGIMLNAIAALENLAFYYGYKGKRIFDYYSGYAKRTSEKELINAIIIQLEVFRSSHSNYSSIYENYDFPKNLSKEQIIRIIKEWKKYIPEKNKIYYREIINYLNGSSDISGIAGIIDNKKKEWGPTTREDLERVGRAAPFINTQMFNQMDNVKENFAKNGNYNVMANLNKDREDNVDMHNLNKHEQNFSQHEMNFHLMEKKIELFFENLIVNKILNNSDVEELKKTVVSFKKLINGIGFSEEEIIKKISLYTNYKGNMCKIINDKNLLNFFCTICDEIISCYQKKGMYSNC